MPTEFDPNKQHDGETLQEIEDYLKLPIEERKKDWQECKHMRVLLDEQSKTIKCQDCKKVLDPFWYLQLLAREWRLRRYQDAEAVKAYRALEQKHKNALARGNCFTRPDNGDGMRCWDCYEALHGHPPEYVYYRGGWYAGEDGGSELFDYIKQQLAAGADRYRVVMKDFIESFKKNNNISDYTAKTLLDEGFRLGREYERGEI